MILLKVLLTKILTAISSLNASINSLNNSVENLTPVMTTAYGSTTSVATGTNTHVSSITLDAGLYSFVAAARFQSNRTGLRFIFLSPNSSAPSGANRFANVRTDADSNGDTYMQLSWIYRLSSETTVYLTAYQNSGETLEVYYPGIVAVRLGD